ncbi:unnamed protein product [Paramecium primaurelia]|uniref:Transmembrane protein n=1 Tax=Paramecium primaurelia TaxID=5886 RepID=A0A8S1N2K7_PARPR|nr:unnamed protein product [Paramecium primaurelia]
MIILIYLICLNSTASFEIQTLDPLYQIAHQLVKIQDDDFKPTKYFSFGIWSKYNPLSAIPQIGPVGLFDSNCYKLLHIIDKKSNELNFIYYDCLDYEEKTIKKTIKFVNNEDEQKIYEIDIDTFEYEDFWYFLEIIQWPLQKRFEILIISQQKIIIHSIDQIKYPFKGIDLQITFGSSLIVSNSRIVSIQKDQKFSYFPGTIIIQKYNIYEKLDIIDWFEYVKSLFENYELCSCQPNQSVNIQDQNINSQLKGEFVSENQNCDSFVLSGWVKIQDIINQDNEFIYPFIKLMANFEDSSLSSDNLSPFQIQYKLSDIQNQILLTTYSYTFPIVSIDFLNDPFLKEEVIDIPHSIKLWHKIQVKLIRNQIDIQIKFYDELIIYEYSYQQEVRQFQQQQFKLLYGNIQQLQSNYLHIFIRNFFFLNCDQTFSEENCHSNCLECDGPTNEDCLSCSEESKRIYLPEHKVCICPYNTIDGQICIGYEESNLEFIDEPFINTDCKYGYFELDNECYQCPSIIKKDLLICVECLQNPKSFSKNPYCQYDLYLSQSNQTERLQWSYPQWPLQKRFEILIISQQKIIIHSIDQIKYPFKGIDLQITFGSSLIVSNSRIVSIQKDQKFSYFPGTIIIQKYNIYEKLDIIDWFEYVKSLFENYELCSCQPNQSVNIQDQNINSQLKGEFVSENQNCDSFVLSGWVKIQDIINQDNEFIYPFIKLMANFEDSSLSSDNLSPFQIQYKLSDIQNQILLTTYSYTFPIVSIDFLNDPFLKEEVIDIPHSIKLWHKIQVKLIRNQIDIQIKFYDELIIYEYSYQQEVRQFQQQQFKLLYGNIQQLQSNYLHIFIRNFFFLNCDQTFSEENCHSNCLECDGPTNEDCLSCSEESKRIYLPEHKVCICPYNTIDGQICIGYEESNLEFIDEPFINTDCKYGYFELDNECYQCPSIIKKDLLICVECLQNPKSFSKNPYCQYDLYLSQSNQTERLQWSYPDQLLFDGSDISAQPLLQNLKTFINDLQNLYLDFLQKSNPSKIYCEEQDFECLEIYLSGCQNYYLSISGVKCTSCSNTQQLIDGMCIQYEIITQKTCRSPNYITSTNQCKLCPKKNCIYCFEYQKDEISFKSTLYKDFESFNTDQIVYIGCAMCEDGFIFDFLIGECFKQQPQIETCLRSFINLEGIEICTLSSKTDFSIAPEIINCQKYYSNCLQCVLTPKSKLQCVLCNQGYISSVITGNCYENQDSIYLDNSIHVIQGDFFEADGYVQLLQSFLMQFLPDQYYYQYTPQQLHEFTIKCKNGYQITSNQVCQKYCSSECLNCQDNFYNFICMKCPLNYYRNNIRVEIHGRCATCSNLCEYCQERDENEIQALQPNFQPQEQNAQYTMKCLKPVDDPNIIINPYLQNVKYCFNERCQNHFSFSYYLDTCFFIRYTRDIYEYYLNFQYCNLVGVDQMTINYIFLIDQEDYCDFSSQLELWNGLKNKIFSLKKTNMNLFSVHDNILTSQHQIIINNYDSVEVKNIKFTLFNGFILNNNNNQIDITLKNLILIQSNFSDIIIFPTQVYGGILIQDVQILDSIFKNSSFFEFQKQSISIKLTIKQLTFKNCLLDNSTLFKIDYIQAYISIENIIIENCQLFNSSFFSFSTDLNTVNQIKLFDVRINQCNYTISYFLKSNIKFKIISSNLYIHNNNLQNSVLITFNDDIELINVRTSQNILTGSSIISTLLIINQQRVLCTIDDFEDTRSSFQDSSLIIIYSSLQINNIIVNIKNVKVQENTQFDTLNLQNQLFKLHCRQIIIQNAQFVNLQNIAVFYLFEINQIIFDSVILENYEQVRKVPLSQLCSDQVSFRNQLLQVIGFQQLSLSNIKILNQFSINYSLMDINFSTQFIIDQIGKVILVNVQFKGNILLKNKQATSLSLINIYSQYNLNIKLNNFQFTQNIINQQIDEPLETQTNLLYISSLDSFVQINQLYCYQNALTNSTNSFITVTATLIEISNLIFMNSNVLPQSLWQQFYDFELEDQYNQQEINSIIQSTFKILNQGIFIVASTFSCTDSLFQDNIAFKSSIFSIKTQGQGIIKMHNIQIDSVYTNLKDSGSTGCISIDSTNSLLNFELKQIKFTNIFNRMAASLFTIIPSLKSNIIRLNNIEITNCLSLMNTIMLVQFSAQVMQQSLVSIKNISIYSNEEQWIQLFSLIGPITLSELNNILSEQNAMFSFENCKIEIINLYVEGIAISPIIKSQNAYTIKLLDCKLLSIQKLYSFDLIHITQTLITESNISIEKLKIIQSNTYQPKSEGIPIFSDLNYKIGGCILQKILTQQIIPSEIISQLQSSNQQSNHMMYLKSISDENSLIFQEIEIIKNNGSDFTDGIITFEIEQFQILKINNMFCYQNSVKLHGCIYFFIQNFINKTIIFKDSYFIQNNGSYGGAILIQNVKLRMKNCKIISNYASINGGGLILQLKDTDFQIESTIITNNQALDGGGIYFNQDGSIHHSNFIKSFLQFNKAVQFGDNLIESPHHLALLINNMEMQSKKINNNQIHNHRLVLKPYKIIEQGIPFFTQYLMIPSYQVINQYQIYSPFKIQYFSYIINFGVVLKNSLNEQLPNILNTKCILMNKTIYEESSNQVSEHKEQIILQFDQEKDYYDLGSLSFILDPYNQENKLLQIEISCQSSQQENSLNYVIQAKSLKCQLGEFYVNSGCQICSSSQGFYSVVYDATKCSIFDKTKFKNITENNIELIEGFWRPNYLSDQIEECFKNFQFCKGGWGQGNQICDLGHIGALCEECDIYNIRGDGKYFKNQQDSYCISCFGVQDSIIPFIAASIWSFISIIITLRSIEQSNLLFKSLKLQQRFSKIIFNLEQGHESFLIKMLLNYLWIFSVIFTFNIQFSFSFTFVDSASNTSYSMTNNLDCYLSENQSIKLIYSKIITMLVLMTFQFILIIMGFLIYNWYKKIGLSNFNLETISNSLLYLYVSNYGGLVKMYFSIVSKRDVSSQSYIQGDVSLLFGSQEHLIWIFSFVIPGIGVFSLIIPLSLFIVMYIKKDQHDNIKIRKHFCYLINEYNDRSYFWEVIKLIKKTIIILILTYFETFILLKASLLGLCLLFYQVLAFNKKPYILSNFNSMDLSSAQICSITIFLAAAKYVSEQENNQFSSIILQTIIVLLCIKLCYSFIKSILEAYSNKYSNLVLNYLHLILEKISSDSMLTKKLQNFIQKSNQRNKRLKILVSKLRQHLLKISKVQIQTQRKMMNSQSKQTQSQGSEQKYLLKIDTE